MSFLVAWECDSSSLWHSEHRSSTRAPPRGRGLQASRCSRHVYRGMFLLERRAAYLVRKGGVGAPTRETRPQPARRSEPRLRVGKVIRVGAEADVDGVESLHDIAGHDEDLMMLQEMIRLPLVYTEAFSDTPCVVLFYGSSENGRACATAWSSVRFPIASLHRRPHPQGQVSPRRGAGDLLCLRPRSEAQTTVVFFDNLDAIGPGDNIYRSVIATLRASLDGLGPRAVTDRLDTIDPSLICPGRFDRAVQFFAPDPTARIKIISTATKSWGEQFGAEVLATVSYLTAGISGANVKAVCVEAHKAAQVGVTRDVIGPHDAERGPCKSIGRVEEEDFGRAIETDCKVDPNNRFPPLSNQGVLICGEDDEEDGHSKIANAVIESLTERGCDVVKLANLSNAVSEAFSCSAQRPAAVLYIPNIDYVFAHHPICVQVLSRRARTKSDTKSPILVATASRARARMSAALLECFTSARKLRPNMAFAIDVSPPTSAHRAAARCNHAGRATNSATGSRSSAPIAVLAASRSSEGESEGIKPLPVAEPLRIGAVASDPNAQEVPLVSEGEGKRIALPPVLNPALLDQPGAPQSMSHISVAEADSEQLSESG
ncbi:hypothetical protein BDK51DRAFT_38360 [Blyttiomyces helicus]|uniref:ATPase AAA-type core domain-containing protein n=1 Tax=Blyttiomyces helicus TaxID=388810 RepID=A0A4P9WJ05_9FUNG|nr:hypothetical protein BDK51DRAFT_38360 [Blyttiomyces helicus]|eukprot:RKO92889.1 hypothetical protein BDK51DRAFT_38360 [Blyttiomyces helicus]